MRWIILILALVVGGQAWATNYCSSDAKGCWLLNEGASTVANDTSGYGNTGTSTGNTWSSTDLPKAYTTSSIQCGDNGDVTIPYNSAFNFGTGNFTFLLWANPTTGSNSGIINMRDGTYGWRIDFNMVASNTYRFIVWGATSTAVFNEDSASGNGWKHLAVVATTGTVRAYKNGNIQTNSGTYTGSVSDTSVLEFCRLDQSNSFNFPGRIAEVAVFARALNQTEIQDIMDNGLSPTASVGSVLQDILIGTDVYFL